MNIPPWGCKPDYSVLPNKPLPTFQLRHPLTKRINLLLELSCLLSELGHLLGCPLSKLRHLLLELLQLLHCVPGFFRLFPVVNTKLISASARLQAPGEAYFASEAGFSLYIQMRLLFLQ
jgi:hypothetical protein